MPSLTGKTELVNQSETIIAAGAPRAIICSSEMVVRRMEVTTNPLHEPHNTWQTCGKVRLLLAVPNDRDRKMIRWKRVEDGTVTATPR
jgi:hypothetical protein